MPIRKVSASKTHQCNQIFWKRIHATLDSMCLKEPLRVHLTNNRIPSADANKWEVSLLPHHATDVFGRVDLVKARDHGYCIKAIILETLSSQENATRKLCPIWICHSRIFFLPNFSQCFSSKIEEVHNTLCVLDKKYKNYIHEQLFIPLQGSGIVVFSEAGTSINEIRKFCWHM